MFDYWEAALKGEAPAIHADRPQPGFYRMRRDNGDVRSFVPVAIFQGKHGIAANVGWGKNAYLMKAADVWLQCCEHPITIEEYEKANLTGTFSDVDEAVEATIGHNQSIDVEVMSDQVDVLADAAVKYATIENDEEEAKALSIRNRINELRRKADDRRKMEKLPHSEAAQEVDRTWMPIVRECDRLNRAIRNAVSEYETKKGDKAAKQIKSGHGRATSVREINSIVAITSVDALIAHYRNNAELLALLRALAQADVAQGLEVPGVKVQKRREVR
jgi:hypothetical protein